MAGLPLALFYPVKTLAAPPVLARIAARGLGFDVSNPAELALVPAGCPVVLDGPLALAGAAPEALARVDALFVGSLRQLDQALARAPRPALGLRLSSTDLLGERGLERSRFGLGLDEVRIAAARVRAAGARITWLHAHHGSDVMTGDDYRDLLRRLVAVDAEHGLGVRAFDIGGGQGFAHPTPAALAALLTELCAELPPGARLAAEPGGAQLAGCLGFAARVVDLVIRDHVDVVLDANLAGALAWSDPALLAPARPAGAPSTVRVLGATCSEHDLAGVFPFADDGPALELGAPLLFEDVSPYAIGRGFGFNGIPAPTLWTME